MSCEIKTDRLHRILYSTDASAYREMPYGVAFPASVADLQELIAFANGHNISLIPRAAGTSLAGQVVGSGLVVDISKYFNKILEINEKEHWVRVQPGVVLDELNNTLRPYGLFFAPETSTSNRCCLGGMVGNNSCGSHSLVYGTTRDHLLEAKVLLSDGSKAVFSQYRGTEMLEYVSVAGFAPQSLEEKIYHQLWRWSQDEALMRKIGEEFPEKMLRRRNCGYALDLVLNDIRNHQANLCKLLAGSEGTLAFAYELKLNLEPLPPKEKMLVCAHCAKLEDVFKANLVALRHSPRAVELMDSNVLELSKKNIEQAKNRFFVDGNPAAILVVELADDDAQTLENRGETVAKAMMDSGLVYHCSKVYDPDTARVWALRKAALGLLNGMKGSAKPVSVIEDTAVAPERLPAYMDDFAEMLKRLNLSCVYHAHIGTGELHLRPVLNLKESKDRELFHTVARETALLVKKHKGSLSGEHGDGRLRGEFIPLMYGDEIYNLFVELKRCWDPTDRFNAGKIVNTPPMDGSLRYDENQSYPNIKTYFNFDESKGLFCSIEQCNGSGDCRRDKQFGGTLCPSYKAGKTEFFATRARANVLRELLSRPQSKKIFDQPEIKQILDHCLSCKACKSECPSNVDMTRLKSEILQHCYDVKGTPFRSAMVARMAVFQKLGSLVPDIYNFFAKNALTSAVLKKMLRFSVKREIPAVSRHTLRYLVAKEQKSNGLRDYPNGTVYLFADEFTNYMEAELGLTFVKLLNALGYKVLVPKHKESGRAAISKGVVKLAKKFARYNVENLCDIISDETPLVGIEPSCILSFRDEYPDLVETEWRERAKELGRNALLFDEFIFREMSKGKIRAEQFDAKGRKILLHGHCHQKALVGVEKTAAILRLPAGNDVTVIPSGCCGMAGSFGYEKEHYDFSLQVGEQVLLPAVRKAVAGDRDVIIVAPGTSCREQIKHGVARTALHPIEVMYEALKR